MKDYGPCMCGDTECPSCGVAQGTLQDDAELIAEQWINGNFNAALDLLREMDSLEAAYVAIRVAIILKANPAYNYDGFICRLGNETL